MSLIVGVPASIVSLVQQGLLQRKFHDGLFPALVFRSEAIAEEWAGNTGTETFETRRGQKQPVTKPLTPGQDPSPSNTPYEQWVMRLDQYGDTEDVDMPTSTVASANTFLSTIKSNGLTAGQSVNRLARNALFKAYLSGQTVAQTAILSGDTSLRVAALNGFRDVIVPGGNVRPIAVNPANPLPISIGPIFNAVTANVVGVVPDDPTDLDGPGTLLLSAAVGTAFATTRAAVVSIYAPTIIRAAGGLSVDAVTSSDTLVLQQIINATGILRDNNVPPHDDGFFHAHISGISNAQLFADPVFQRLNQSLPEHVIYKEGFVGTLSGVMFFMNSESPRTTNSGTLVATAAATGAPAGKNGVYASDLGAEVVNGNGVAVGRVILTGKGALYERWLDESKYVSEAGVTGKVGEFDIVNNSIQVMTDRIRLVLRAPQDRLQQKVSVSWSTTLAFPVPSDVTARSGVQRFKRAAVLEFATG